MDSPSRTVGGVAQPGVDHEQVPARRRRGGGLRTNAKRVRGSAAQAPRSRSGAGLLRAAATHEGNDAHDGRSGGGDDECKTLQCSALLRSVSDAPSARNGMPGPSNKYGAARRRAGSRAAGRSGQTGTYTKVGVHLVAVPPNLGAGRMGPAGNSRNELIRQGESSRAWPMTVDLDGVAKSAARNVDVAPALRHPQAQCAGSQAGSGADCKSDDLLLVSHRGTASTPRVRCRSAGDASSACGSGRRRTPRTWSITTAARSMIQGPRLRFGLRRCWARVSLGSRLSEAPGETDDG
jgi:hypothetical protein